MIDFIQRGFHFVKFLVVRWTVSRRIVIRSRFYNWLNINLCLDSSIAESLHSVQEISKNFARTILKPDRVNQRLEDFLEPGIFVVSKVDPGQLKIILPRAICLRLLTPANRHMSLKFDGTTCILEDVSDLPESSIPLLVESDAQFREPNSLTVWREALISGLFSSHSTKL